MQPVEYEVMARVEEGHWWYRGLRDALTRVIGCWDPPLPDRPRVLDAGCGTGANLALLSDLLRPEYLGGFDFSDRAVELSRARVPGADVYVGDLRDPEIRESQLDLILSMDVLCIPGVQASLPGLRRLVASLAPGGRLVLHLPAFQWLYSEHDVAVHTTERYRLPALRGLLGDLGLEVEWASYRIFLLFPAVLLARATRLRRPGADAARARSDLHDVPGPAVTRTLLGLTRLENRMLARGWTLPWGSSVMAVARKP